MRFHLIICIFAFLSTLRAEDRFELDVFVGRFDRALTEFNLKSLGSFLILDRLPEKTPFEGDTVFFPETIKEHLCRFRAITKGKYYLIARFESKTTGRTAQVPVETVTLDQRKMIALNLPALFDLQVLADLNLDPTDLPVDATVEIRGNGGKSERYNSVFSYKPEPGVFAFNWEFLIADADYTAFVWLEWQDGRRKKYIAEPFRVNLEHVRQEKIKVRLKLEYSR